MDAPLQSFLDAHAHDSTALSASIPHQRQPICCCGNDSCAVLKHGQSALEVLERDVDNAARLGQVCFAFSFTCLGLVL